VTTNNAIKAGDTAEAAGVPLVTPSATGVDVTRGRTYVFRTCFTDEFQGPAAANFAYDGLGARRAAILVNSGETYSMGLGEVISTVFQQRGGQVVSWSSFSDDTDDFSGQISQMKPLSPDVVFLPAYYEAAAKCITQARADGFRGTFVGTDGWDSPKLYTLSGGAVTGNYFTNHFSPDEEREVVKTFVKRYQDEYGEAPGAIAALSYDAAKLVFDAVRRAGSADRDAIAEALAATRDYEGVSGRFSIDENHNPVKDLVILETGETGPKLEEVIAR
jgi:branched-chain amino acid transport system substrate-binding protein